MAIYVYVTATGQLVSWCPNDTDPVASPSQLTAQGYSSVSGLPPLGPTVAWNPATKTTMTVSAPTPANVINTFDFIMAFTPAELAAIRASTDPAIQRFLFALQVTQGVNLNAASITNALTYLVTNNLLTAARAQAIAATINSGSAAGSA